MSLMTVPKSFTSSSLVRLPTSMVAHTDRGTSDMRGEKITWVLGRLRCGEGKQGKWLLGMANSGRLVREEKGQS